MNSNELLHRSEFLLTVVDKYAKKTDDVMEIGCGDGRNVSYLQQHGYRVLGIDKELGTSIEEFPEREYDVVFTMSCLFLLPEESEWVFEKIARMTKKYLITIEGETTKGNGVIGRDYGDIFTKLGMTQIEHQMDVFNKYGVMRVFKK